MVALIECKNLSIQMTAQINSRDIIDWYYVLSYYYDPKNISNVKLILYKNVIVGLRPTITYILFHNIIQ